LFHTTNISTVIYTNTFLMKVSIREIRGCTVLSFITIITFDNIGDIEFSILFASSTN